MFFKSLSNAGHTRRFIVSAEPPDGWEVRVEEDSRIVRQSRYSDWHRVERAVSAIERQVGELEAQGWQTTASSRGLMDQSMNL